MPKGKNEGRAREVAARGVNSLQNLANVESPLMADILAGEVSPSNANGLKREDIEGSEKNRKREEVKMVQSPHNSYTFDARKV